MITKLHKLLWVVLLVVSAFVLGYYLNPSRSASGGRPPFLMNRPAPPLRFNP